MNKTYKNIQLKNGRFLLFSSVNQTQIFPQKKKNRTTATKTEDKFGLIGGSPLDISLIRSMLLRHNVSLHSSSVKSRERGISLGLNCADSRYSKMDSIITLCILTDVSI